MWKSDGPLVQVAIGPGVADAPSDQQFDAIVSAASTSLQSSGITLPHALISVDNQLAVQSVTIYLGIQSQSAHVASLDDIAPLLAKQVTAIAAPALELDGVQALLAQAVSSIAVGDYSSALTQYCRAYYHGALNGYQTQTAQALTDVGNIDVQSGDLTTAATLLGLAHSQSGSAQFTDANLRIQLTLNLANVQALTGDLAGAAASYHEAGSAAFGSGNPPLFALALTGLAEVGYRAQGYPFAVAALADLAKLVAAPSTLAQAVSETIAAVSAVAAGTSQASGGQFDGLRRALLVALTTPGAAGSACALLDVDDALALTLFGAGYHAQDPAFEDVTAVGDGIIQNMKTGDQIIQNMKSGDGIIQNMKSDDGIIQNMK